MPSRELDRAPRQVLTWQELLYQAKVFRSEFQLKTALQQNFSKTSMAMTEDGLKVFALGNMPNSLSQTLLSVNVPVSSLELFQPGLQEPLTLHLQPVFKTDPFKASTPSAEFSLMCERQRSSVVNGITDYSVQGGNMLLMSGDQICRYSTSSNDITSVKLNGYQQESMDTGGVDQNGDQHKASQPTASEAESTSNFVSEAKICPCDSSIIAYVLNKQVYIEKNGRVIYHTTSTSPHITNGVPSYICLEELERFEGIWWSKKERRLLYEHVNEESVDDAAFGVNGTAPLPPMKYPKAGTTNATSTLKLIVIDDDDNVLDVDLKQEAESKFSDMEYITRAGFFSDGKTVYTQMMNRQQNECLLFLIPDTDFELPETLAKPVTPLHQRSGYLYPSEYECGTWEPTSVFGDTGKPPRGKLRFTEAIHRIKGEYWVNVHNAIVPLELDDAEHPLYEFIYCLESANGSSLYLLQAELNEHGYCQNTSTKNLMDSSHSIFKSIQVVADEKRKLVYYVANKSRPVDWNVCVASYKSFENAPLTDSYVSFRSERANPHLALHPDVGFACWVTNLSTSPICRVYSFRWTDGYELPHAVYVAELSLFNPRPSIDIRIETPEIVEYLSPKSGFVHYGMVMRPANFDPYKKYPVMHYVYGGPGVQIVHNDYCSWVPFLKYTRLGYVVVMIDNRGSANRGIEFESQISTRMGTVEVMDQIEGLHILAERSGGFMDMDRVVVHGWSYGGYMALLLLANHPKMYRAAIAGGAVTDWKLYDTAYTERYMGFPVIDDVYSKSSVLQLVDLLPDEPHRLMLVHGLMDENVHVSHLTALVESCIKKGKHHELVIFPSERHGIRNAESAAYLDARMLFFMQQAIAEPINMKQQQHVY